MTNIRMFTVQAAPIGLITVEAADEAPLGKGAIRIVLGDKGVMDFSGGVSQVESDERVRLAALALSVQPGSGIVEFLRTEAIKRFNATPTGERTARQRDEVRTAVLEMQALKDDPALMPFLSRNAHVLLSSDVRAAREEMVGVFAKFGSLSSEVSASLTLALPQIRNALRAIASIPDQTASAEAGPVRDLDLDDFGVHAGRRPAAPRRPAQGPDSLPLFPEMMNDAPARPAEPPRAPAPRMAAAAAPARPSAPRADQEIFDISAPAAPAGAPQADEDIFSMPAAPATAARQPAAHAPGPEARPVAAAADHGAASGTAGDLPDGLGDEEIFSPSAETGSAGGAAQPDDLDVSSLLGGLVADELGEGGDPFDFSVPEFDPEDLAPPGA